MGIAQDMLKRIAGGMTSLGDLSATTGHPQKALTRAVQQLKKRGLALVDNPGNYSVTPAGVEWLASGKNIVKGQADTRPRKATRGLRQRAWWVIRARKAVTLPDLLTTLADGDAKAAGNNLARYLLALEKTGFLALAPNRLPGNSRGSRGYKRYCLVRDNGRLAPVLRRANNVVFDPNTGETFPLDGER